MKKQSLGLLFTKRTLLAGLVLLVCGAAAVFLVRIVQPEGNSKHLRKRRQHEQQVPIPPERTAKKANKIPKKLRSNGMRKQWQEPVRLLVIVVVKTVVLSLSCGLICIIIINDFVYKKVRKPEPKNNDWSTMQRALEQRVNQVQNDPLCYRDFSDKDFVMTLAMKKKEDGHFLMIIDCWSREHNVQILPKDLKGIISQYFIAICSGFDMTPKTLIYGSKIVQVKNDAYDVKLFTNVIDMEKKEKKQQYKCITYIAKRTETDDGYAYSEPVYVLPNESFQSAKEVWLSRDGRHLGMINRYNTYVLYQLKYVRRKAGFQWTIKRYISTINDYSAHGVCIVKNADIHFLFPQKNPDKIIKASYSRDDPERLNKQEIDLIPLLSKESIDMDLEELFVENFLSNILLGLYFKWFAFGKHKKALQKRLIPYVYIPYARTIGISWDGEQLVLKHQAWYKFQYIYPFVGACMGGNDREVERKELTLGIPKSALL